MTERALTESQHGFAELPGLHVLTDALVVRQLQPWYANLARRQVKSPRIYIRDSGPLHLLLSRAPFELNVALTDSGQRVMVQVGAATAVPRVGAHSARAAATLRIARADLDRLLLGKTSLEGLLDGDAMRIEGDAGSVRAWLGALDRPAHWFNVVVP